MAFTSRRGGRVAEGGGLLNRYTVKSCIGGSNPPLSARNPARHSFPPPSSCRKNQSFCICCPLLSAMASAESFSFAESIAP